MSSKAQIDANRANAKFSTGPFTEAGKAASSQNRGSHFLSASATFRVLEQESQEEFDRTVVALKQDHNVRNNAEASIVQRMAEHEWMRRRAGRILDDQFDCDPKYRDPFPPARHALVALMMRYESMHERAYNTAFNQLLKLRAASTREEIGFERQRLHCDHAERQKQSHEAAQKARHIAGECQIIRTLRTSANNPEALQLARDLQAHHRAA